MMIRHLLAAILAFGLALPGTALAQSTVTVWHSYRGKERAALETVARQFNEGNEKIQIELLPIPYDAFADKITASIPRGKGPDLFIFAQDRIGDWAQSRLIEPIDFWIDDETKNAYLEPTMEALTYDRALYGLPMAFKTVALFYNKALVKQAPSTTDALIAEAKKHTKPAQGRFGLVYENANFYYQAPWLQGFGGRVFDAQGNPSLDSKEAIASMAFAQHLAHEAGIMPQEVTNTLVTTLFNKGDAAFVINGPWFLGEIDSGVDFGVALMPEISPSGQRARPFLTAEAVIMSARAKDKMAAFEVMQYLTSAEAGRIMAREGRQTAARAEVYRDPAIRGDAVLQTFKDQLQYAIPMPNTPAMRMVWSPATTAMNKVINGKVDPAAAMKEAQQEVQKLLRGARR